MHSISHTSVDYPIGKSSNQLINQAAIHPVSLSVCPPIVNPCVSHASQSINQIYQQFPLSILPVPQI